MISSALEVLKKADYRLLIELLVSIELEVKLYFTLSFLSHACKVSKNVNHTLLAVVQ